MTVAEHAFQTEVQQLLHLMIHSLYTEREIFLRELVSNASDACDKLRFQALTDDSLYAGDESLQVEVRFDSDEHTLTITDSGIGLTETEAVEHLGTIARSGTKAFVEQLKEAGSATDAQSLIGQFGVGFYSSFMVADKVVVESRKAGTSSDAGVRWESTGDGSFSTETIARPQRGTTVTLHLKEDAHEFAQRWRLQSLIKKYSDYVAYPVMLPKEATEEEKKDGKDPGLEQVNAGTALWARPKDEISDEQYNEFYKSVSRQWDEPATRLHFNVEGTLEFSALLFVPSERPFDFLDRDKRGISLYVRRVFIMDDCTDLLPEYLRFVKGVVDSSDLPLNVSREMLQQQAVVSKLRKILTKRILDHLEKVAKDEPETYARIDRAFGPVLREGIANDFEMKQRLAKLARFVSSWTETQDDAAEPKPEHPSTTGLDTYIERMAEGQEAIYYVTATSHAAARKSPHLEGYRQRGYEVLYLVEPIDDYLVGVGGFDEFEGKKLVHVAKGADDLASAEDKEKLEAAKKELGEFLEFAGRRLEGVKEVRLSARLTDSPCCLVADEGGMSQSFEQMMKAMGRDVPEQQRILELNPEHPLVRRLDSVHKDQPEVAADYLGVLRDQAILAEGGSIGDGAGFARRIQGLLDKALG